MKKVPIVVMMILYIGLASAMSCNPDNINLNVISGNNIPQQSVSCSNPQNITVLATSFGSFFGLSGGATSIIPFNITTYLINFNQNTPIGFYQGAVSFSDGTNLPINLNLSAPAITTGCQINPSLLSYSQPIQQGTQVPMPKITFSPTNCPSNLVLSPSNVNIQGGILTPTGQKPVSISSIISDGINLNIDTTGLQTQTYSSILNINAFSKTFQIPINVIVTSGTSLLTNCSIKNLPSCSLTSTVLNLNNTYSMICSNIAPDQSIQPNIDHSFIIGTGVDTTSNTYTWNFQPVQFGNTLIKADFFCRGATIGQPYVQEVSISASGVIAPGTSLNILFTPSLTNATSTDNITIQLVDNRSGNLVSGKLFINAFALQNDSNGFYHYNFQPLIDYNIRAIANGYNDFTGIYKLLTKIMKVSISPLSGDTQTTFSINSDANATIYIDDVSFGNSFNGVLKDGNHKIQLLKEGWIEYNTNISVEKAISIISSPTEFKSGINSLFQLSRNVAWTVYFQKDENTQRQILLNGTSETISFIPENSGTYTISTNSTQLGTYKIEGFNWSSPFGIAWYVYAGLIGIIFILLYYNSSQSPDVLSYQGKVNS